ncbi:hypothetical protein NUU61_008789 [Penicillium alfredii]|uniref:BHLH domain-containing protein n=1 Tax=Penicillium alfredii TaxID=1506179 RepID=A0A9W9JWM6_9EURO|nr:uncharacterized protein NUU61_008789 [Penicillium alfredii]KAJ5084210.1 hypothetical protein NUU61_008789 [Penicillium alfredii]
MQSQVQTRDHQSRSQYSSPNTKAWPAQSELQWGTDPSFGFHGFSSPIGSWTEERMVQNLMRNLACMCSGIDFDGASEPSHSAERVPEDVPQFVSLDQLMLPSSELQSSSPQSRISQAQQETTIPTPVSSSLSQHTLSSDGHSPGTDRTSDREADAATPPSKKRKCIQKSGQETCHCRSEKRRRELVGRGYRDLCQVVPSLRMQSFTRKHILNETAALIEELVAGNDALQRQLEQLEENKEGDEVN